MGPAGDRDRRFLHGRAGGGRVVYELGATKGLCALCRLPDRLGTGGPDLGLSPRARAGLSGFGPLARVHYRQSGTRTTPFGLTHDSSRLTSAVHSADGGRRMVLPLRPIEPIPRPI